MEEMLNERLDMEFDSLPLGYQNKAPISEDDVRDIGMVMDNLPGFKLGDDKRWSYCIFNNPIFFAKYKIEKGHELYSDVRAFLSGERCRVIR